MDKRIRIVLAVVIVVSFIFVIWNPGITGFVSGDVKETVVVVLRASASNSITGGFAVEDESLSLDEQRVATQVAQQEVLSDVNSPSVLDSVFGVESVPVVALDTLEVVPAMVVEASAEGIAALQAHPLVEAVYSNVDFELVLSDSVPLINANDVWGLSVNSSYINGSNVSVCVIDTGISAHSAFESRVVDQKCFCSPSCCPNGLAEDSFALDTHPSKHGTHVSGIIASNGAHKGVAPGANIVSVKVCDLTCGLADIYAGIDYCLSVKDDFNVVAISGSLGDGGNYVTQGECPTFFDSAIDAAFDAGIVSVFASGNNGYLSGISYPGCSPNAIGVGAVTKSDVIASFTNRGSLLDVLAPGVSITSTVAGNGFGVLSGTSQATPHVSGVVALLKQYALLAGISLSPLQVKDILQDTAILIDSWKRVDALAAVSSLDSAPSVSIDSPFSGSVVSSPVSLVGSASDVGPVVLSWSSSVDGFLGVGSPIEVSLSVGSHVIFLNATDGSNLSNVSSINLSVVSGDNSPVINLSLPYNNSFVLNPVSFDGFAVDFEDGNVSNISWFSSVDGFLSNVSVFSVNLSFGNHSVALTAVDADGNSVNSSVNVVVMPYNNSWPVLNISVIESIVRSPVNLSGVAFDSEDGVLNGSWFEGDVLLGVGNLSVYFAPGSHNVSFVGVDSLGFSSSVNDSFISVTCEVDVDFNGNSVFDIGDFVLLLGNFSGENLSCNSVVPLSVCTAELDRSLNGSLDIGDFVLLLSEFANESLVDVNGSGC